MKPSEVYAMPSVPQWWDGDDDYAKKWRSMAALQELTDCWHNHLPELGREDIMDIAAPRVTVRIHYDPYIDGERCCTMGSAWFDGKPIMVFRHAGRSGHDFNDRFITDSEGFYEMLRYIRSLLPEEQVDTTFSPDEDLWALDAFYGHVMEDAKGPVVVPCSCCAGQGIIAGNGSIYQKDQPFDWASCRKCEACRSGWATRPDRL